VGMRSMIVVPLMHAGTAVGVLKVMGKEPGAFTEADVETLSLSSDVIAAAMFNATLLDQNELFHRATHDTLTGLANRALFYDRLRLAIAQSHRSGGSVAVVNLDMDGLKPINDEHGHRAGDAAIKEVAERILHEVRETDTVARVGGDEFSLVLAPVEGRDRARHLSERIAQRIARPFVFESHELSLSASMGFALSPDDGDDIEGLIEQADQAMYAVKRGRQAMRA
jgi:diguanylate cyclase (GGDEF)-like protein